MININPLTLIGILCVMVVFIVFSFMYLDIKELKIQKQVLMKQISDQNLSIERYKQNVIESQKKMDAYIQHSKELIHLSNEKVNKIMKEKIPSDCKDVMQWGKDQAEQFK